MTPAIFDKRLSALEAARTVAPVRFTPEEAKDAAQRYEASLYEPAEPDPRAEAYWATATVYQLAADYAAICRRAPAPWE